MEFQIEPSRVASTGVQPATRHLSQRSPNLEQAAARNSFISKASPSDLLLPRHILQPKPAGKHRLAEKENAKKPAKSRANPPQPDLIREIIEREIHKQHLMKRQQERKACHSKCFDQIADPCLFKNKPGDASPKSVYEHIINASFPNTPPFPLSKITSPIASNRGKRSVPGGGSFDWGGLPKSSVEGPDEDSRSPTTRTIIIESNRMLRELVPRASHRPVSSSSPHQQLVDGFVSHAGPRFSKKPAGQLLERLRTPVGRNRICRETGQPPNTALQISLGDIRQQLGKSQLDVLLQTSADEGRNFETPCRLRAIKNNSSSGSPIVEEQSESDASCLHQQRPSKDYTPAGRLAEDPIALENKFDLIAAEVKKGLSYLLRSKNSASGRQPVRPATHLESELDSLKAQLKNLELENKEKDVEIFNLCVHLQDITKITRSLMRRVHRTGNN